MARSTLEKKSHILVNLHTAIRDGSTSRSEYNVQRAQALPNKLTVCYSNINKIFIIVVYIQSDIKKLARKNV